MSANRIVLGLAAAIVFQLVVLVGMVGSSALPLLTGTEIRLIVRPVDPRSLFRGNYARLQYDISTLDGELLSIEEYDLRQGEIVYVSLEENASGVSTATSISLEKPEGGIFIRGRTINRAFDRVQDSVFVNYGIDAFFASPEEALALERDLRSSRAIAEIMVSGGGVARIKRIRDREGSE